MKNLLFLFYFICFGLQLSAQKPEAYELYLNGTEFYQNNKYKEAADKFSEAEEGGIHTTSLYNQRGICYYMLKQYVNALSDYNKALSIEPTYYAALSNKCNAYYGLKDYQSARDVAKQLIRKKVYLETAYNTIGNIEFDAHNYTTAIENYRKAIQFDPNQSCSFYNIGNSFFQMKMYDTALFYHQLAREISPEDLKNLNNISKCYSNTHRISECLEICNSILAIDSSYFKAYAEIGFALMDNPNYNPEEVIPYLKKATELAPDEVYYSYNNLGNAYLKMGLHNKALEAYNNSIRINPHFVKSYSGRADIYRDSMQFEKAIADFMMAVHIDSTYNYPNLSLGGILLRLNDKARSDAYYQKYIDLSTDKRDAYRIMYNSKAYNQVLVGDFQGCLENTALSLWLDPKYAYAWNNRGFAMAKTGKYDSAFICFELSNKIDPYNSYVYHNRAYAYAVTNKAELACADLKKAKEMHFPVRIDPLLIELNEKNCHLIFSNKTDTVIANMDVVLKQVEQQQKLLIAKPELDESNKAEQNLVTEKMELIQSIYPNPATGEFTIQLKARIDKALQVQAISSAGSQNRSFQINDPGKLSYSVQCADWTNGTYILIMVSDGRQIGIGKVIVQH